MITLLRVSLMTLVAGMFCSVSPMFTTVTRADDNTVTTKDAIAGTMNITFNTRTNLDSSGDLKEGSAALGARTSTTTP